MTNLPESELYLGEMCRSGDSVLIRFGGDLCYENAGRVTERLGDALALGPKKTVMDLTEIEMIDSSGLRVLLECRRRCREAEVEFELARVSRSVARVVSLSGFSPILGIPPAETLPGTWVAPQEAADRTTGWRAYESVATSDPSVISVMRDQITRAATEAGAVGDTLCDIQIAVGEALTNAYRHGSPLKGISQIQVLCLTCPGGLVVEIQDEGEAFDPDATPEPDPVNVRDHGMGLYLMRQAMDVVEFSANCPGNKVRMVKWIEADAK